MAVTVTIAMIAVLQFMVLQCGKRVIKLTYVIGSYAVMLILSFSVSSIFFNKGSTEIRGSHCKGDAGPFNTAVWILLAGVVPLALTVLFSILTCLKVKKNVSMEHNSVVQSVILLNTFNVVTYLVLRVGALLVYFTVVSINPSKNTIYLWTLLARCIGELNYPLSLCSILIVHSGIRNKICNCCKMSTPRTRDSPKDNHIIT